MNNLVTVWCEWDIGQDGLVFKNEHVAERWLRNHGALAQQAKEQGISKEELYQEWVDDCSIGIHAVQLIE